MGQDARNRVASTIVADALTQLPAPQQDTYNNVIGELASTGAQGIEQLTSMLVPAADGKNNKVEYALNGIVAYVCAPGHEAERDAVRQGLKSSIDKVSDEANKAFILTLLQHCGTAEDASFFAKYVADPYLQEWAINGLIAIPGSESTLMEIAQAGTVPNSVMAYALGKKGVKAAEPMILQWAEKATGAEARPFYKALGKIGTAKSMPVLAKAAKAQKYAWEPNGATEAYVSLLNNMAANGETTEALAAAKSLMKATDKVHVRGAAMNIIFELEGKKALPVLLEALKDNNRAYRVNALRQAEPWVDAEVLAATSKIATGKDNGQVKADILNWYGTNHTELEIGTVIANFNNPDAEISNAAIKAAGKIGGEKALNALATLLGSDKNAQATAALLAFNGKVNPAIIKALDGDANMQVAALPIASARRITKAADKVFALMNSSNKEVAAAALEALPGVVAPENFEAICSIIEAKGSNPSLQAALKSSVRNLPAQEQYNKALPYVQKSKAPYNYYSVLAQSGTKEAVAELLKGYNSGDAKAKEAAVQALTTVNGDSMIPVLYGIAQKGNKSVLNRYVDLVNRSAFNPVKKFQLYRQGLEVADNDAVKGRMLSGLANTLQYPAFLLVAENLNNAGTAKAAAEAMRVIASKNTGNFGGQPMRAALEKARDIFKAGGTADDGYAVDDINGLLANLPEAAFEPLQDKDYENFELLFEYQGNGTVGVRGVEAAKMAPQAEGWNTVYVLVLNDRITIIENGVTTFDNQTLVNSKKPGAAVADKGKVILGAKGEPIEFRNVLVRELPSTPLTTLSAEEAAEGFQLLFDGRSMHNFTGNTVDYTPVDGNIYVSAKYGNGGNLYTKDKYSDFIFRFEFCFDVEGVNNGIGIRTKHDVDAAYDGMEIQILDHDAPMYSWLREYQQHGSVYGIIPAKRVKHKPLGQWSTEEIRAVGDHITVTVNGEVILDGNIREACQGHNVDPDGTNRNPYTVDHLNHPGLFNKDGYICFCGHGEGVRFRNIRVKDLSKKSKK